MILGLEAAVRGLEKALEKFGWAETSAEVQRDDGGDASG